MKEEAAAGVREQEFHHIALPQSANLERKLGQFSVLVRCHLQWIATGT
jgi:hypothetical protein